MRLILLVFALLALAQPVSAQCIDIPSCKGAEVEARERRFQMLRETEAALPTQTPRPTKTPIPPTLTYTPMDRPTATNTPQPVATATVAPSVTVMPTREQVREVVRIEKPEPLPLWIRIPLAAIAVGLILFAVAGLRKPTTE